MAGMKVGLVCAMPQLLPSGEVLWSVETAAEVELEDETGQLDGTRVGQALRSEAWAWDRGREKFLNNPEFRTIADHLFDGRFAFQKGGAVLRDEGMSLPPQERPFAAMATAGPWAGQSLRDLARFVPSDELLKHYKKAADQIVTQPATGITMNRDGLAVLAEFEELNPGALRLPDIELQAAQAARMQRDLKLPIQSGPSGASLGVLHWLGAINAQSATSGPVELEARAAAADARAETGPTEFWFPYNTLGAQFGEEGQVLKVNPHVLLRGPAWRRWPASATQVRPWDDQATDVLDELSRQRAVAHFQADRGDTGAAQVGVGLDQAFASVIDAGRQVSEAGDPRAVSAEIAEAARLCAAATAVVQGEDFAQNVTTIADPARRKEMFFIQSPGASTGAAIR